MKKSAGLIWDGNQPNDEPITRGQKPPSVKIMGRAGSATAYKIRDYLQRNDVPFEWIEMASDQLARTEAGFDNLQDSRLPVCVFSCPTVRMITEKLGGRATVIWRAEHWSRASH